MLLTVNKHQKKLIEVYYLLNYFLNINNLHFDKNKFFLTINIFIFIFKTFNLTKNKNFWNFLSSKTQFLNLNSIFKLNFTNELKFDNFNNIKKIKIDDSPLPFFFLNIFFFFNYSFVNTKFTPNYSYKFFHYIDTNNKILITNSVKVYTRWKDAYYFFYNIFYYNLQPLIFGTPFFKHEILSLNWYFTDTSFSFWKFHSPLFFFKSLNHGPKLDFFFDKLIDDSVNFFIITDCLFHFKILHYMRKKNLYTIGFVDIYTNPWIVSYPIISFVENFINQSIFIKLLIFVKREVLFFKFKFFKKIWFKSTLFIL